jgi:hypothetical protein
MARKETRKMLDVWELLTVFSGVYLGWREPINDGDQTPEELRVTLHIYVTSSQLRLQYLASPGHDSDIRLIVAISDGVKKVVSPWVGPVTAGCWGCNVVIKDIQPGHHILMLQPEGRLGGSNQGALYRWGGTVEVYELHQAPV